MYKIILLEAEAGKAGENGMSFKPAVSVSRRAAAWLVFFSWVTRPAVGRGSESQKGGS
jgi:hypothetical protein